MKKGTELYIVRNEILSNDNHPDKAFTNFKEADAYAKKVLKSYRDPILKNARTNTNSLYIDTYKEIQREKPTHKKGYHSWWGRKVEVKMVIFEK